MQKLLTIALGGDRPHGDVQDHLAEFLAQGWRVASVTPAGRWLAVVLERATPWGMP
jgi:hypothetical protein